MEITCFGLTDIGRRREKNEDSYLINTDLGLYLVADGMGGHLGGEFASRLAVSTVEEIMNELLRDPDATLPVNVEIRPGDYRGYLKFAIGVASNKIYERAIHDPSLHGMGTTLVASFFRGNKAYIANVGDSRCYLVRAGKVKQVTEDHSLVSEQLKAGIITLADARNHRFRNIITRSVGFQDEVDVDVSARTVKVGDKFALCTDGLTNMVSSEELLAIVAETTPRDGCYKLMELANERGGEDNITVIINEIASLDSKGPVDDPTEES